MAREFDGYYSVSNHTKWMELRAAVLAPEATDRPEFRSRYIPTGHISGWDCEWFYHFQNGGFEGLEWIELRGSCLADASFQSRLEDIGLSGQIRGGTVRVFGYVKCGEPAEILSFHM